MQSEALCLHAPESWIASLASLLAMTAETEADKWQKQQPQSE